MRFWLRSHRRPQPSSGPGQGRENGQATLEFALIIPFVFVAVLGVVQVAAVAYAQLAVTHTAREAARMLSVDPFADLVLLTDNSALLGTDDLHIEVEFVPAPFGDRQVVCVIVSYDIEPISSVFEVILDDVTIRGTAKMLVES